MFRHGKHYMGKQHHKQVAKLTSEPEDIVTL